MRIPLSAAGLLTLALTAACKPAAGREVVVDMTNFRFGPAAVDVAPGERVTWVLRNRSDIDHEFGSDAALLEEVIVPPRTTRTVAWTAPSRPSTYSFDCAMRGHEGMVMTVNVR